MKLPIFRISFSHERMTNFNCKKVFYILEKEFLISALKATQKILSSGQLKTKKIVKQKMLQLKKWPLAELETEFSEDFMMCHFGFVWTKMIQSSLLYKIFIISFKGNFELKGCNNGGGERGGNIEISSQILRYINIKACQSFNLNFFSLRLHHNRNCCGDDLRFFVESTNILFSSTSWG